MSSNESSTESTEKDIDTIFTPTRVSFFFHEQSDTEGRRYKKLNWLSNKTRKMFEREMNENIEVSMNFKVICIIAALLKELFFKNKYFYNHNLHNDSLNIHD